MYPNVFSPAVRGADSVSEESCKEGEDSSQTVEKLMETQRRTTALVLDSLNKAALHLRRAMVLHIHTWKFSQTQVYNPGIVFNVSIFNISRCWPIVAATGLLCSVCVRLCGIKAAVSLS